MELAENHHRARKPTTWHRLAPPAILFVIVVGFYWKLTLVRGQFTWLNSPDLAYQVLPWFDFQAREWHQGRIPLWDPNHSGGQSLIGQAQPGSAYPLNWLLFSLPLRNGRLSWGVLNGYYVLIHFMAALFCYWLSRDLKRSHSASLLAGAAFGLGGYIGTTNWPQMINGAVWAPLIFLFLLRVLRGRRPWSSAAFSGVFTGMAWLSGHHQIPIFTCLAVGGVWLYFIFRKRQPDWRVVRLAAVWLVFTGLAGALQILPAYEYGRLARRWVGAEEAVRWNERVPYMVHWDSSLELYALLGVLVPGMYRSSSAFIGVTGAALVFLGLAGCWRKRAVKIALAVALGGLLFSLGRNEFLHGVLYGVVPLVEKARNPAMAVFIFHFGIAVLLAYGFDTFLRRGGALRRVSVVLAIFSALLWLAALCIAVATEGKKPSDDRILITALVALLLAGLFHAFERGALSRSAAMVCLFGLLLTELGNASFVEILPRNSKDQLSRLGQSPELIDYLRRLGPLARIEVDEQEIPYNVGDWNGLDQANGYMASLPDSFIRVGALTQYRDALYGVAYEVNRKPPKPGQELVFEAANGLKVYRNPGAFPRVWTVHRIVGRFEDQLDLHSTVVIESTAPALEPAVGADEVRLVRREPNLVTIEADMRSRGMVVLSDNYAPGWQATVDGAPAQLYPAYVALRGVVVPAGRHQVEMRYRLTSVYVGGLLTLLAVAAAAGIALWERRQWYPTAKQLKAS